MRVELDLVDLLPLCSFSLRQMQNNAIDLEKVKAETTEKIAAVNSQKVTIVASFIGQMKVRVATFEATELDVFHSSPFSTATTDVILLVSPSLAAEGQAHHGEGAPEPGDGGADGREEPAGARL